MERFDDMWVLRTSTALPAAGVAGWIAQCVVVSLPQALPRIEEESAGASA